LRSKMQIRRALDELHHNPAYGKKVSDPPSESPHIYYYKHQTRAPIATLAIICIDHIWGCERKTWVR
jgi:hypothetical protein